MPVSYAASTYLPAPAVHVIHENPYWTAPLFAALESCGIPYYDWNLGSGEIAGFGAAPEGVFYNGKTPPPKHAAIATLRK